tara:strand:- start:344 stop:844 length:501 start_codon:yes stop_codon:yes gene_type:complete
MRKIFFLLSCIIASNLYAQNDTETFQQLTGLEGKWTGTINYTNKAPETLDLKYTITAMGTALVEESSEGGVGMMTVFNLQNQKLLLTHYCAAQNRPVAEIAENKNGALLFKTNHSKSDLNLTEDFFVTTFKFDLLLNDENTFRYEYTAEGADGESYSANAVLKRVM